MLPQALWYYLSELFITTNLSSLLSPYPRVPQAYASWEDLLGLRTCLKSVLPGGASCNAPILRDGPLLYSFLTFHIFVSSLPQWAESGGLGKSPCFSIPNRCFLSIWLECVTPYLYPLLSLHAEKVVPLRSWSWRKVFSSCSAGCQLLQPLLSPPSSAPGHGSSYTWGLSILASPILFEDHTGCSYLILERKWNANLTLSLNGKMPRLLKVQSPSPVPGPQHSYFQMRLWASVYKFLQMIWIESYIGLIWHGNSTFSLCFILPIIFQLSTDLLWLRK